MRNPIRSKNLRLRFVPAAAVALFALWSAGPMELSTVPPRIGAALVTVGLALRSWGAGHLVKRERLTVSGPYAHHRHPLYAGTLLIVTGFACLLGGVLAWGLALASSAWFFSDYFPRKERHESGLLEARFGAAYVGYRARVPALLPRLGAWRPSREVATTVALSSGWRGSRWLENNELGTLLGVALGATLVVARRLL